MYSALIFYSIVYPPQPFGNLDVPFLLPSFPFLSVSTILTFSLILDSGLPATQLQTGIWNWWITVSFSYTMIPATPVLFGVSGIYSVIMAGNKTCIISDVLGSSLALCGP